MIYQPMLKVKETTIMAGDGMSARESFATEVRNDIIRYRDALKGILGDVYSIRPELAPQLHELIAKCDGVLAVAQRMDSGMSLEVRRQIGQQVANLKTLTERFLQELSSSVFDGQDEEMPYKGAAA